jgi:hypothetical protein
VDVLELIKLAEILAGDPRGLMWEILRDLDALKAQNQAATSAPLAAVAAR